MTEKVFVADVIADYIASELISTNSINHLEVKRFASGDSSILAISDIKGDKIGAVSIHIGLMQSGYVEIGYDIRVIQSNNDMLLDNKTHLDTRLSLVFPPTYLDVKSEARFTLKKYAYADNVNTVCNILQIAYLDLIEKHGGTKKRRTELRLWGLATRKLLGGAVNSLKHLIIQKDNNSVYLETNQHESFTFYYREGAVNFPREGVVETLTKKEDELLNAQGLITIALGVYARKDTVSSFLSKYKEEQ